MTDAAVHCTLCPHRCRLSEGQLGLCGARVARDGAVLLAEPGLISALALDPIEKKPFMAFHPGSWILSVGQFGCNMRCSFCQNHDIALARVSEPLTRSLGRHVTPQQLVTEALALRRQGNIGLCFTYNEPLIAMEFVRDCFALARAERLVTALVTNGCCLDDCRAPLLPLVDAWNIDLKCFTAEGYRSLGGELDAVQATIREAAAQAHVEVTTLIVPDFNSSEEEIDALAAWLASLRPDIPLHLSRFFPRHQMQDRAPTARASLAQLAAVARRHLERVELGNV